MVLNRDQKKNWADLVYILEVELTELIEGLSVGSEGKEGGGGRVTNQVTAKNHSVSEDNIY